MIKFSIIRAIFHQTILLAVIISKLIDMLYRLLSQIVDWKQLKYVANW